jgi:hypothetical protein
VSAHEKFPKNPAVCLAPDQAATSSSFPRCMAPIRNSARTCAARHYDEFASAKPDSGTAAAEGPGLSVAPIADHLAPIRSCRHMLEGAIPQELEILLPPKTEEEAGGRGFPVPRFLARN